RYNQCCDPGSNRGTRLVHKSTLRRVLRQHMRIRLGEWSVAVDVSLATALTICTIAAVAIDLMGDKRYPPWDSDPMVIAGKPIRRRCSPSLRHYGLPLGMLIILLAVSDWKGWRSCGGRGGFGSPMPMSNSGL